MKGGVAVQLQLAAAVTEPSRDLTFVFYDGEEVDAELNGLARLGRSRPELLAGATSPSCSSRPTAASRAAARARCGPRSPPAASPRTPPARGSATTPSTRRHRLLGPGSTAYERPDGRGRRAGLPRGPQRGRHPRRHRRQRHPRRVRGHGQLPLRARARPRRRRCTTCASSSRATTCTVTDSRRGARPGLRPAGGQGVRRGASAVPVVGQGGLDRRRPVLGAGIPAVNFGPGDPNSPTTTTSACPVEQLGRRRGGAAALARVRWPA